MPELTGVASPRGLRETCTCGVEMVVARKTRSGVFVRCPHCDEPCLNGALCGHCQAQWRAAKE